MKYQIQFAGIQKKLDLLRRQDPELQGFGDSAKKKPFKMPFRNILCICLILATLFSSCGEQQTDEQATTPSAPSNVSPIDSIDWESMEEELVDDTVTVIPEEYIDFEYKRVVAFATIDPYDFHGITRRGMEIYKFEDTLSKALNKKQIARLDDLLSGRHRKSYVQLVGADCFNPRHNIAFLDKKDSVVNYVSICFECGTSEQSKRFRASHSDLRVFFEDIGLKVFDDPGDHRDYYDSLNQRKKHRP